MPENEPDTKSHKRNGFSLVELLAVVGLAGAGTLGIMQLQKSQLTGQKKVEAKYEASTIANAVGTILLSKESCEQTFSGRNFSAAQNAQNFNAIMRSTPSGSVTAFQAPQNLGNIDIVRFEYQLNGPLVGAVGGNRYGSFNVGIVYQNKSRLVLGSRNERIEVPYTIKVETDPSGGFLSCHSEINDVEDRVSARACASIGGIFNPTNSRCSLTAHPEIPNRGTGASLTQDNFALLNYRSFRDEIYPRVFRDNFLYRMAGGDTVSGNIQMSGTATFRVNNVTADADAINKKYADEIFPACPTGTVGIFTSTGMRCENLLCENSNKGSQQYLVGFNPNGSKICNPLVSENNICQNGGRLSLRSNGSLQYECCTPECSNSGNFCSNTVFPSNNNCGNCPGTKLPKDATWGNWVNTGNSRTAGGATCSATCGGGFIATEIEQVRVCNSNSECGGSTCVGNSQQWVLGPSQACNTQACPSPGKCTGYGNDSSLFILGSPDTGSCAEGYRYQYLDIVVAKFKRGNIYSVTQGHTWSEEVKVGDTPQTVLQRLANKINSSPATSTGACGTSPNQASVVSSNRMKYRVQWQHSTYPSASHSCNDLSESTCTSTPGCNWNTTSAYVCSGWNYTVEQGTCNGTYYKQGCAWNGMGSGGFEGYDSGYGSGSGSGGGDECMYSYHDATSCNAAYAKGCYWGSIAQTCYASTQASCSALGGGCSWKKYPDLYRSCTAASYESACTGDGAGVCTWGPR